MVESSLSLDDRIVEDRPGLGLSQEALADQELDQPGDDGAVSRALRRFFVWALALGKRRAVGSQFRQPGLQRLPLGGRELVESDAHTQARLGIDHGATGFEL